MYTRSKTESSPEPDRNPTAPNRTQAECLGNRLGNRIAVADAASSTPTWGFDLPIIHRDPQIQGGVPIFAGTRVPLKNLFDSLEAGDTLDQFLDDYPLVTRDHALAALELALESAIQHAPAAG